MPLFTWWPFKARSRVQHLEPTLETGTLCNGFVDEPASYIKLPSRWSALLTHWKQYFWLF